MNKAFKNIAVFSLWLAGLVIMIHLLIPHDHHSEASVLSKEEVCHAGNTGHPANSSGFPIHCHVLNDLTFEKTSPYFAVYNYFPTCNLLISNFSDFSLATSASYGNRIKDFQKPFKESDFLQLSSFRAPPALS
ncbi:MAG: hypothetical protein WCL21_10175 [Mariniphaga sp.]